MSQLLYVDIGYVDDLYFQTDIIVDWGNSEILIPRTALTLLQETPIEVRQLDITDFHERLRDLEDDEAGIAYPVTHNYAAPTSISGVILAQVMEILTPYTVTFEDGAYAVNVVGGNSNIADRVNINNVGVRTANSAGLQDLTSLQAASFDGEVSVDITSRYAGTTFPIGTRGYPVNNLTDAHAIAEERGINQFNIFTSMTITDEVLSDGYRFMSDNTGLVTITIEDAANINTAIFENVTVQGVLDNYNLFRECIIKDVTHINGIMLDCLFTGTITLDGVGQAAFHRCGSGIAGVATRPHIVWASGSTTNLAIRDYQGGLELGNCTEPSVVSSLDFSSGELHISSSMSEGVHTIRGISEIFYEIGYTATISDSTLSNRLSNVDLNGIATTLDITNQTADLKGIDNRDLSQVYSNTPDVNLTPVMTAIADLNDFDPTVQTVVASNMRGTDGANTVAPDNASIAAILMDTNELQLNQGEWSTATGFATVNPDNASIAAIKAKTDTLSNTDLTGIATSADIAGIPEAPTAAAIALAVEAILADDFSAVGLSTEALTLIGAIKAKTDKMVFTKDNELDVNQISINSAKVYGSGIDSDKWRGTP